MTFSITPIAQRIAIAIFVITAVLFPAAAWAEDATVKLNCHYGVSNRQPNLQTGQEDSQVWKDPFNVVFSICNKCAVQSFYGGYIDVVKPRPAWTVTADEYKFSMRTAAYTFDLVINRYDGHSKSMSNSYEDGSDGGFHPGWTNFVQTGHCEKVEKPKF